MPIQGADVEALEEAAVHFERGSEVVLGAQRLLHSMTSSLGWSGPDQRRYRNEWEGRLSPMLVSSADLLTRIAGTLRIQAHEQTLASADDGRHMVGIATAPANGRGTGGPPPTPLVPPTRPTPLARLAPPPPLAAGRISERSTTGVDYLLVPGTDPRRQFLVHDPRGDGRAVEVFGDLATARRIGIWVPGVGSTIADFDDPASLGANRIVSGTDGLAMIQWLGYDPPDTIVHAAVEMGAGADRAAEDLNRFVDRLRSALPDGSRRTIIIGGHSYGAVVAATAASQGTSADTLVLAGAPGVPVRSVDEMTLNGAKGSTGSVFVAANTFDPVRVGSLADDVVDTTFHSLVTLVTHLPLPGMSLLGGIGHPGDHTLWSRMHTDPTGPSFGATRLSSGPGSDPSGILARLGFSHRYTEDNPEALAAIRRIFESGPPDRDTPSDTNRVGRSR